jgi:tetratricopeptide (TPR) repeat protein
MNTIKLALMMTLGLLFTNGCAKDEGAIQGVSSSDAARLNAQHSTFETAQDPPVTAQTRFAAGQLSEAENNPVNAAKQYEEALKLDPNHAPSLYRLGVVCAGMKQFDKAIVIWKRYVTATGESADAYGNLAFCQELAGYTNDAELTYQKGIALSPKNVPCRVNYGLMLARHNRAGEAIRQWQAVLTEAEVHYNLASVYEMQNRKEQARVEYQKALELNPRFVDAKTRLTALDQN